VQSTGGFARILLAGMVGGQGYLGVSVFFGTDDSNKWGVDENSQIFDQILDELGYNGYGGYGHGWS
jgi:hypothetical protein